jgi:hypothetical protein
MLSNCLSFAYIGESDGRAICYGLDGQGVGVRVRVEQAFLLCEVVQTGSEVQQALCPMGMVGVHSRGNAIRA